MTPSQLQNVVSNLSRRSGQRSATPIGAAIVGQAEAESELSRCPRCGRRHHGDLYLMRPTPCGRCRAATAQAERWASADTEELVALCERIGVGSHFIRDGRAPSYDDAGLADRIARNPLPAGGLFIFGAVGAHKTHLASARAVDAARRGFSARLVSWAEFLLCVRDTFKAGADRSELDVIREAASLDYLALDDFAVSIDGAETDASVRVAYQLLNARYAARRTTDVTTNIRPGDVADRFDARVARRLRELTQPYLMLLGDVGEDGEGDDAKV